MDVVGGGVLVAVAAALWIVYLLPNWFRRRQYEVSERHAIRLQQTLRVLAETAETPDAVRLEATAREVVAQQRILAAQEQAAAHQAEAARLAAEAEAQMALVERRAAEQAVAAARERATRLALTQSMPAVPVPSAAPLVPASSGAARAARRRGRALCSLAVLVSTIVVLAGLAMAWPVALLVGAVGVGAVAAIGLVRLARPGAVAASSSVAPVAVAPPAPAFEPIELPVAPTRSPEWTPQPLPRPLHLSRGTIAATAMASVEAAAKLQRAVTDEAIAAKAERRAPKVPVLRPAAVADRAAAPAPSAASARPAAPARAESAPNPYAAMGIVGKAEPGFNDLDTVLRRRRAV
ncbi:hypothetical protein M3147_01220 [Agromyces mediolanus]|uniref:hypothetical protein n=1 Tax=Agromyces mediolanus TaxID=41986 RepID=UPI00203E737C|nr:hypothetical protein [Agromyces mediolanus]MCM3655868.1 hypothetical protein [Agromyces mediolanus]